MTIIDRYLLRQFFKTFLICYVSLTGLYVVFDAFTNVEQFISCAKQTNSGTLTLVGSFYSYQSILIFDRTAALLTLVAAMFTVAWIQRHNEMTALMSAGITRVRIVVPVMAAAMGIILFAAVNRELVIPKFREQLAQRPQDLTGGEGREMDSRYDAQTGVLISGRRTFADRQRIEAPSLRMPPTLQKYGKQIVAKNAFYRAAKDGRPSGYLLDEVERPQGLAEKPSLRLEDVPVLITPADAPDWLEPNQCFVRCGIDFDQLTGGRAFREFSSVSQLMGGLRNDSLGFGADVRVAIHSRLVQPFLDITLLMLGLPLVVTRHDRNVFVAIGLCLLVVTVFLMVVIGAQQLGAAAVFSAALAAWLPLMIFVPPAVWLGGSMSR